MFCHHSEDWRIELDLKVGMWFAIHRNSTQYSVFVRYVLIAGNWSLGKLEIAGQHLDSSPCSKNRYRNKYAEMVF